MQIECHMTRGEACTYE